MSELTTQCPECFGDGEDLEDSSKDCWKCGGSGSVLANPKPCPACGTEVSSHHEGVKAHDATLTTLRAENERLREFVQWVAEREDAEDVLRALTNWDHADVYRTLAEAIERARAALKGGG